MLRERRNERRREVKCNDLEKAIRERAYYLWEGGCQDGHASAHWLTAQREILSASFENARVTASQAFAMKSKSTRKLAAKKKQSAA
jgi:hypothetical protein